MQCRCPAGKQLKRLVRWRSGFCGIDHLSSRVAGELERFEVTGQFADDRVMEALNAGAVERDVLGRPADGNSSLRVDSSRMRRVAASFGPEDADGVVGDGVPIEEELGATRVEDTNRAELTGRAESSNSGA